MFRIDENKEVRLWNRYMSNTYEHLSKMDNTLQDAGLYQGQVSVQFHVEEFVYSNRKLRQHI